MKCGSYAIVTGVDEAYVDLLEGWLGSLQSAGVQLQENVVILDCGLNRPTVEHLRSLGICVVEVGWDVNVSSSTPSYFRAMTARPNLPKHIPNKDWIIWLDADCWVQKAWSATAYISAASNHDIACCLEIDRNYSGFFRRDMTTWPALGSDTIIMSLKEGYDIVYARHFATERAKYLIGHPPVNSGVFCAHRDSPLWAHWNTTLKACFSRLGSRLFAEQKYRRVDFLVEQVALNGAVYSGDISASFMPATYNWLINMQLPAFDENYSGYCEPGWPFAPIYTIHMTVATKRQSYPIQYIVDGVPTSRKNLSLTSPNCLRLRPNES